MTILKLKNVSIMQPGKPSHCLVDAVSCEISAGEILGIIGPNGAGKSSLLKAISGDWPHQGTLDIIGVSQDPVIRARQIAVLPQFSLLNFPYRVSEVVSLGRIPHQSGIKRDEEIVEHALAMMDISFLKDRLYTQLSGGEKQRVQLARVFAQIWDQNDAENGLRLLMLDEPTTALDLGHQQALMTAVRNFASQNVGVVMVLHDVNLAARYADKILALLCSQVVAYGSVQEVITRDNIKRLYEIDNQILEHPVDRTPMVIGI